MSQSTNELTVDQRNLVSQNINLVYGAWRTLKGGMLKNLYKDELINAGMVALCKSARTYDSTKGKFSTYATRLLLRVMSRMLGDFKKHSERCISLDKINNADEETCTLSNLCEDNRYSEQQNNYDLAYDIMKIIKDHCNSLDLEILHYIMEGFTYDEIGSMYGCSRQYIGQRVSKMRQEVLANIDK